jgi:hypothetical protein
MNSEGLRAAADLLEENASRLLAIANLFRASAATQDREAEEPAGKDQEQ